MKIMTEIPIRVFVGCAANNEDLESQLVLEHSILKNTSCPVDITWMQLSRNNNSPFYSSPETGQGWHTHYWATPFSGFRWIVPELCNYQGRAIYFDSDFIVFGDIAELWNYPMQPGKVVVAKGATAGTRYCCSLWDCAEYRKIIDEADFGLWVRNEEMAHQRMCRKFAKALRVVQEFSLGDWNVMDIALPDDLTQPWIKAIHYTHIPTQLQTKYALPRLREEGGKHWNIGKIREHPRRDLQKIFDDLYEEAGGFAALDKYRVAPYGNYDIRGGKV